MGGSCDKKSSVGSICDDYKNKVWKAYGMGQLNYYGAIDELEYSGMCAELASYNFMECMVTEFPYLGEVTGQKQIKYMLYKKGAMYVWLDATNAPIYYGYPNGPANSHAVTLAGWGTDSNGTYWIVKNSWGADWGLGGASGGYGYIRFPTETGIIDTVIPDEPVAIVVRGLEHVGTVLGGEERR